MNDIFENAIKQAYAIDRISSLDFTDIIKALELGKLHKELNDTIDTYKRVAIKEQIKKIEGDGE